jgi:hypothetical protein
MKEKSISKISFFDFYSYIINSHKSLLALESIYFISENYAVLYISSGYLVSSNLFWLEI